MQEFPLKRKGDQDLLEGKAFPSFRMLSEDEVQKMLSLSSLRKYRAGEVLFEEGDVDPNVYFIIQGHLILTRSGKVHAERRRRGDIVGSPGVAAHPREEAASAKVETTCLALDTSRFQDLDKESLLAFHYYFYRMNYPL